jgi:uncharacterized protein YycO
MNRQIFHKSFALLYLRFKGVTALLKRISTLAISLILLICTNVYSAENQLNTITNSAELTLVNAHEKDALEVLSLIEKSQYLREQLPSFVQESSQAIVEHHGALPSAYALRLAKALAEANIMRNHLFEQALKHRGALYRIDGNLSDAERVTEIVIAMSAAIALFENNKAMRAAFEDSTALHRKLNEGYPEFGIPSGFYDSSILRSANPEYRKAMTDAIRFFADNKETIEKQISNSPESIHALYAYVADNSMLQDLRGGNILKELVVLPAKVLGGVATLSGHELGRLQFTSSKIIGNTIGMVRWRAGKLKNDKVILQTMLAHLQPGDILLEKTPFTLTDKSIPGHFGHAAIYVGTVEQLREMDALDLPIVQKNLSKIESGHVVVEALRNGVHLDTLQDFMNVDDVAILRPKNLSIEERREAVNLALANLGKKYDFNFDVNTTETIVCSELVYIAYPQVDFVTKRVLGSFTITPDDIAQQAGAEDFSPLALVLFGHNGRLVFDAHHDENGLALYDALVKGTPTESEGSFQSQHTFFEGFVNNNYSNK